MHRKFELGASKIQGHGNISLLLLMSLPKTVSAVIYQSSFAFSILDLASFLFSIDLEDTKPHLSVCLCLQWSIVGSLSKFCS
jgi:hypothetical protein